jgi:hypothetical protein
MVTDVYVLKMLISIMSMICRQTAVSHLGAVPLNSTVHIGHFLYLHPVVGIVIFWIVVPVASVRIQDITFWQDSQAVFNVQLVAIHVLMGQPAQYAITVIT